MQAATFAPSGGILPLRRTAGVASQRSRCCAPVQRAQAPRRLVVSRAESESESIAQLGESCSIDDMGACSLAELEMMYIDSLWSFYTKKDKFTLSDAQYDRLKDELSWQGSGFPTLRREEVKFVEASISFAQGEPIMSDEEYEKLKIAVQLKSRRADVTALLLYSKGQQMLEPAQYELLREQMNRLGIDVGLKGASCTLSETDDDLSIDFESIFVMYAGLAALPFFGSSILWKLADTVLPVDLSFTSYLGFTGLFTISLVAIITNVAEISKPYIVKGCCPCCETPVVAFFKDETTAVRNCQVCGTSVSMDRSTMKLTLKDGPKFV